MLDPQALADDLTSKSWSAILMVLDDALGFPARRTSRHEDFLVTPKKQLDILAGFLGNDLVDDDWSRRCAATVRKPRPTWRDLPEETARSLTAACVPGFEQLQAAGVYYDR